MTATTLTDRALIRLSGEDVRGFLQGLITNNVLGDLPVYAGLLTPQGKALFDFLVWADGDDLLIDCEAARAEILIKRLSMYRLRRPISIAVDPRYAVYWSSAEPDAGARHHNIDTGPWPVGTHPDPRNPALGWRWLSAPTSHFSDGSSAYRAHRLALGIFEGVAELGDGTTLWLYCNAREQNGVDFAKGCYVGQENTARMHYRDKANRKLAVVPLAEVGENARATYPELGLAVVEKRER